jgi:valyl-tRNA synthetase
MARPGLDSPFDETQMKVGRRLAMKVLNVAKFVLGSVEATRAEPALVTEPVDRALLGKLARALEEATRAFDAYDYTTALEQTEKFFWDFCDDYVELVKERAYGSDGATASSGATESAKAALATALHVQLRMFAPFLPYATEEVWSWWQQGSVHLQAWPTADDLGAAATEDPAVVEAVAAVLAGVRGAKSTAKVGMRTPVEHATITGPQRALEAIRSAEGDLRAVGSITGPLDLVAGGDDEIRVDAVLGEPPPKR